MTKRDRIWIIALFVVVFIMYIYQGVQLMELDRTCIHVGPNL